MSTLQSSYAYKSVAPGELDDAGEQIQEKLLNDQDSSSQAIKPSNQLVLGLTCASFALFVIAEIIGALAGNSLSLLGDAAAMSVDVFNYLSNMFAERAKSRGGNLSAREQFVIEVVVPTFSVTALLSVTGYITSEAISVLMDSNSGEEDDTNVLFLFGFAGANMFVDLFSGCMFWLRGKDGFVNEVNDSGEERTPSRALSSDSVVAVIKRSNLNMLSALTAVTGDTLRTFSVFCAALVATFANVPGNVCDAWAAIIVTITIVFIAFALISEIYKNAQRFRCDIIIR